MKRARDKIMSIKELATFVEKAKPEHTVVMAHGVFDGLHPGHTRHFEAAAREGSVLVVTITGNAYVNKGPNHPYHSELLRAEIVAALDCVEAVAVWQGPAAPISQVKPDVYVKDKEYENPEDDITGKIVTERREVESYGGRIVFTDEIRFSSSEYINRHLNIYEPEFRSLLTEYRTENAYGKIKDLFATIENTKWVVVGETIIDEYVYGTPLGKPAKENILAVLINGSNVYAGGAIAAANHLASFVRDVEVVTAIGEDEADYVGMLKLVKDSLLPNVKLRFTTRVGAPTTRKTRIVDKSYTRKMFEMYRDGEPEYQAATTNWICQDTSKALEDADGLIAFDYGHGMFMPDVRQTCQHAKFLAVNAQTNARNHGYNPITKHDEGADYICLDAPEARLAKQNRTASLNFLIEELAKEMTCRKIIITAGAEGCVTFDEDAPRIVSVPAFTGQVVDTIGAGDAFLAVTAPLVAAGGRMDLVGFVGNAAGAIKVGIVGHQKPVSKVGLIRTITSVLK